jgi:hypothetical protein
MKRLFHAIILITGVVGAMTTSVCVADSWKGESKKYEKRLKEWNKERAKNIREWEKERRKAAEEWDKHRRKAAQEWYEHQGWSDERGNYYYAQPYYGHDEWYGAIRPPARYGFEYYVPRHDAWYRWQRFEDDDFDDDEFEGGHRWRRHKSDD